MKVELHTQEGVVGEIEIFDGVAVGSNALATSVIADQKIVAAGRPPTPLTPADGERYLRALPLNIAGTYFWATLVD